MKVAELIKNLSRLPGDTKVLVGTTNAPLRSLSHHHTGLPLTDSGPVVWLSSEGPIGLWSTDLTIFKSNGVGDSTGESDLIPLRTPLPLPIEMRVDQLERLVVEFSKHISPTAEPPVPFIMALEELKARHPDV